MKLVFYKSKEFEIGHVTVNASGQKVKKVAPGKWIPVSESSQSSGKEIKGLTFKDGFYFDGKTKITNNYEKAKNYIQKKESQSSGNTNVGSSIKVGDIIRVKANAKSNGKVREHKEARGMVARVQEIGDKFVKIIDDAGKVFQVNKMALEFAKSNEWLISELNLIKSKELQIGIKVEKEHANTIKKIKNQNLDEKQSATLIAKDHMKEAKDKGYDYYKRLLAIEGLEDRKGIDGKIIKFIKTHNFIEDEKDIHEFAKTLNMSPHKLEEKIYAILKDIIGNEVKKSKSLIFNLQKARPTKYIKRIPKAGGGYKYIYKEKQDKNKQIDNKDVLINKLIKKIGIAESIINAGFLTENNKLLNLNKNTEKSKSHSIVLMQNGKDIFGWNETDADTVLDRFLKETNTMRIWLKDNNKVYIDYRAKNRPSLNQIGNVSKIFNGKDITLDLTSTDVNGFNIGDFKIYHIENANFNKILNVFNKRYLYKSINREKFNNKNDNIYKSNNIILNLFKSDQKLDKIKKILLFILDKQMEKSFILGIFDLIKGKAYPVGTTRDWKGKRFIKVAKGKWRRLYEGESRGQKQSIAYIKKQIENAKSISELAKIVFENKKRFLNSDGSYHNVVKQLLELAKSKRQGRGKDKQKRKEREMVAASINDNEEMTKKSQNETEIKLSVIKYGKILSEIIKEMGSGKFNKNTMSYFFPDENINLVYSKLAEKISDKRKKLEENGISKETISLQEEEDKFLKLKYANLPGDQININGKNGEIEKTKIDEEGNIKHDVKIENEIKIDIPEDQIKKNNETNDNKIKKTIEATTPENRKKNENSLNGEEGEKGKNLDIVYKSDEEIKKLIKEIIIKIPEGENQKVKDYSEIRDVDVKLVSEKDILNKEKPSYILPINERNMREYQYDLIFVKLEEDKYLLKHKIEEKTSSFFIDKREEGYFIANSAVMVATRDYYLKKAKAEFNKKIDDKMEENIKLFENLFSLSEKEFNNLVTERVKKTYSYISEKGIENEIERYKKELDRFKNNRKEFEKELKNKIIKGLKREKIKTNELTSVFIDHSNFYRKFNPFVERRKVVSNIVELKKELYQKSIDMEIQMEFDANTYSKGEETSYGDTGTKDTLLKNYGVKIKRQNGKEINKQETEQLKNALDDMYKTFGSKSEMSRKFGLKLSHAGSKMMHARKASGIFFPVFHAIGISFISGEKEAGFTLSHEYGHFMDYYLARNSRSGGFNYASDNSKSIAGQIAKKFRTNMKKPQSSKYYNRTCECFARAMEQYHAVKQGVEISDALGAFPTTEYFKSELEPLIDTFLTENKDLLKSIKLVFKI